MTSGLQMPQPEIVEVVDCWKMAAFARMDEVLDDLGIIDARYARIRNGFCNHARADLVSKEAPGALRHRAPPHSFVGFFAAGDKECVD